MNYRTELEISNENAEIDRVTEANKITEKIRIVAGIYAEQSARTKLDNFKLLMRNMPVGRDENPYLSLPAMEFLGVNEALYYICCKMANYIKSRQYIYLADCPPTARTSISYIPYKYNIPLLFMPIFISYILSFKERRATSFPIAAFFSRMDTYLDKYPFNDIIVQYPEFSKEQLVFCYKNWMVEYLGRNYFIHLENLFNKFSTTEDERKILRDSTAQLTDFVTFPSSSCTATIEDLDKLLLEYQKKLASKNRTELYNRTEPFIIEAEKLCIATLKDSCRDFFNTLCEDIKYYMNENHLAGSAYTLSVKNFNDFKDFIHEKESLIEETKLKIADIVLSHYRNLAYYKDIKEYINSGQISINCKNINYKIKIFFEIFIGSLRKTGDTLDTLFSLVEKASCENPSKYSAQTREMLSSSEILEKIKEIYDTLNNKISGIDSLLNEYPSLYLHKSCYAYKEGFPIGSSNPELKRYLIDKETL